MQDQTTTCEMKETAPDLYCSETFDFFEEDLMQETFSASRSVESTLASAISVANKDKVVINNSNPTTTHHEIHRDLPKCVRKKNYTNFDSCISMLDDNDYMKIFNSHDINDDDNETFKGETTRHHFIQDSFTSHLLKEFTKTSIPEHNAELLSKRPVSINSLSSNDKADVTSQSWSQTRSRYDHYEQQVPEITLPEDEMQDNNIDILVIKDEAMTESDSSSELDWNSLTPPVPASPSDQRVPETESEVDLFGAEYDHRMSNSSPELFSSFVPDEDINYSRYFSRRSLLQNFDILQYEDDQVVPLL